jgi:hypothetical protein
MARKPVQIPLAKENVAKQSTRAATANRSPTHSLRECATTLTGSELYSDMHCSTAQPKSPYLFP